jgi:hypothetical protein
MSKAIYWFKLNESEIKESNVLVNNNLSENVHTQRSFPEKYFICVILR